MSVSNINAGIFSSRQSKFYIQHTLSQADAVQKRGRNTNSTLYINISCQFALILALLS